MTPKDFIKRNEGPAIDEALRSGIPASITMAQAILESGSGNSWLAKVSNNLFGIKCHGDWYGEHVLADDDREDECFRKYPSTRGSFRDHTEFLKKHSRYDFLFKYPVTDWKNWAAGLQKAGYATSKTYAQKLGDIIRHYKLWDLDSQVVRKKMIRMIVIPVIIVLLIVMIALAIYKIRKQKRLIPQ